MHFYEKRRKKYGCDTGVPRHVIIRIIAENAAAGKTDAAADLLFQYYEVVRPSVFSLENLKQENRGKAIELYKLALKADPNCQTAREALEELESK